MVKGEEKSEIVLGIDLGTSNSAACIYKDGNLIMVPSAEGHSKYGKSFPSYVAFTRDGEELVGEPAKRQGINNVDGTISAFKRQMGKDKKYNIHGKEYTPEELSARILQKIKIDSEDFFGEEIDKAVITVPANFNNNQRTATKDAAELVGINVTRLISEPTAASLAYGFNKSHEDETTILVFDFGGGTLDVTIMEISGKHFDVVSTSGNNGLGGNDMDYKLAKYLAEEIKKEYDIDLFEKKHAELMRAAEDAKIELSTKEETPINLRYIALDKENNPINFETTLKREKLESIVEEIVNRCGKIIKEALDGAHLTKDDIDKVILVGGPTKMPIVQKYVQDYMGKPFEKGVDPMECVAQGASILADIVEGQKCEKGYIVDDEAVVTDVTPHSLGTVENNTDTVIMIEKNAPLPYRHTQTFKTLADDQEVVECIIVEGEDKIAKNNAILGSFELKIPPGKKGEQKIDVTFVKDESNLLTVTARSQKTGKSESLSIDYPSRMSIYEKHQRQQELKEMGERYKAKKKSN